MMTRIISWFLLLLIIGSLICASPASAQGGDLAGIEGDESLNQMLSEENPEFAPEPLEDISSLEDVDWEKEIEAIRKGADFQNVANNHDLDPAILPTGESKSAVTPQALSLPSGEASISGMGESFQPLLTTGAASMSIPIALPPGRAGVQPSLAFSYLSTAGNGPMGIGWLVSGPFISRQTDKGMPHFGEAGLSNWQRGILDRFIYNGGEEIVPVATPTETADCRMAIDYEIPYYDPETGTITNEAVEKFPDEVCGWWYFRTRLEGAFLRFFWNPDTDRWVVQDKNGTLMYFDPAVVVDDGRKTFQWNLTKIKDVHGLFGNTVYYEYDQDGNQSYLRHIWYNSPVTGDNQEPQDGCGSPGDFTCYGHHVELQYEERPDPIVSYGSGFRVETNWRLIRVTVESRDLYTGSWVHTRDYDISYNTESYWSLVDEIQLFGRNRADSLPAMVFGYTEVEPKTVDGGPDAEIPGFGGIDGTIHEFAWSPPHSVSEGMSDLFDANHDGFADLLVTDMARYDHGHGLFINICDSSGTCSFTETDYPVKMWGGVPVGPDFDLANTNLNPLDIDSDGIVEFLHMPHLRDYEYFRIFQEPSGEGLDSLYSGYYWDQVGPFDPDGVDPDIDFTRDASEIRLLDLNNDHMVDVLRTTGTRMEHWVNLGRCKRINGETGDGKFGTPLYNQYGVCSDWTIEPITSCVLYRGMPKKFSDGDLRLADMNGDGMQDIVHVRWNDVAYWPGRGQGLWGDGEECPERTYGDDRETLMTGSYPEMRPDLNPVFLSDVNGDGLSDLVQVRFDAVDIWINVGGYEFMPRHIIDRTPAHPGFTDRVRFADVDGTGTPDLLWGDASNYRYMDFSGGIRPRLLTVVENGLGKVTAIDYQPSTVDYVRDMENGRAPESVSPLPSMVVSRVTVSDSLGWEKVTEYYYHDGYYDGCEAEFRGYQEAEVREVGDANSPTSWTRTRFHVGQRPSGMRCLEDNPYEGLKGQLIWSEIFDETGVFLETDWSAYKIEYLYSGLNSRDIYQVYGDQSGSLIYDTSRFEMAPEGSCEMRPSYQIGETETQICVPLRSTRNAKLQSEIVVDHLGNILTNTDQGVVDNSGDEITSHTRYGVIGSWLQRPVESWVDGHLDFHDVGTKLKWSELVYDSYGNLLETWIHFDYPDDLDPPIYGWTIPDNTSKLSSITSYLRSGVINGVWEGVEGDSYKRHVVYVYDTAFGALQESELVEVGPFNFLTAEAQWDAGLGAITSYTGYSGEESVFIYDALGRIEKIYVPGCSEPATVFVYILGNPLSYVQSIQNETCQNDSSEFIVELLSPPDLEGYLQYSYVDGLGRSRATIKEGDTENPWIVEGHIEFDAKGAAEKVFMPYSTTSRWSFSPVITPQSLYSRTLYDAFGRTIREYSSDGEDFIGTAYGLFRNDQYEKSDFTPGTYFGTTTTQYYDGHGQITRVIDRLNLENGNLDLLATDFEYDTLGNVIRLESGKLSGDELSAFDGYSVFKLARYDSNGMLIFQDDPDRGKIYFVYNELGDLVRWQDGRGITNGFKYDLGGRLISEDYGYTGIDDVLYGYDIVFNAPWYTETVTCHRSDPLSSCPKFQQNILGRLSFVKDRAGIRIWSYDPKGQIEWVDKQISSYETEESTGLWVKRDDLTQIWHVETVYDELGRAVWEDFPEEGARVFYKYSERGLIDSVHLDRLTWTETMPVIKKVYYNEAGMQTRVEYGDNAQTTIDYNYDMRQRLVDLFASQQNYVSESGISEDRTLMDYSYRFDVAGNISSIIDHRDSFLVRDWSSTPVNYYYKYDSLNRLTRAQPVYHELQINRVGVQEWNFDKLGSMTNWTDPNHNFYGWSLNNIRNGLQLIEDEGLTPTAESPIAPHAIYKAYDVNPDALEGKRGSFLIARYDRGGNMTSLEVYRGCGECNIDSDYSCEFPCESAELTHLNWDEVGRLQETKTLLGACNDTTCDFSLSTPISHYQFTYDTLNLRTVKKDILEDNYTIYFSEDFEIRNASISSSDEIILGEEIKYISILGSRLARIAEDANWLPENSSYYLLYLSNHLGSSTIVSDSDSGEIVESNSYLPFGGIDARNLNPDPKWQEFNTYYTYSGKEKDENSSLMYFGERYLNPALGRWTSTDKMGLLEGSSVNAFSYAENNPIVLIDPSGLQTVKYQHQEKVEFGVEDVGKIIADPQGGRSWYFTFKTVSQEVAYEGLTESQYEKITNKNWKGLNEYTIATMESLDGRFKFEMRGGTIDDAGILMERLGTLSDIVLEIAAKQVFITKGGKKSGFHEDKVKSFYATVPALSKAKGEAFSHEMIGHPLYKVIQSKEHKNYLKLQEVLDSMEETEGYGFFKSIFNKKFPNRPGKGELFSDLFMKAHSYYIKPHPTPLLNYISGEKIKQSDKVKWHYYNDLYMPKMKELFKVMEPLFYKKNQ